MDRGSISVVGLLIGVVIVRLLDLSSYGLIGIISIFITIAQTLIDSGVSNSLIQRKNRTEVDFSTIFCSNVVVALLDIAFVFRI